MAKCIYVAYVIVITTAINVIILTSATETGCISNGKFGWKCRFQCACKDGAVCDRVTGACSNGCRDGLYGVGCLYDNRFSYGENGKLYAGNVGVADSENRDCMSWRDPRVLKLNFTASSFIDGNVPGPFCRNPNVNNQGHADSPWCYVAAPETSIGISLRYCDSVVPADCPNGMFGRQCENQCHCLDVHETCDKGTGKCLSTCAPGWRQQINCHDRCKLGTYGYRCVEKCGKCLNNEACDPETGHCPLGCAPGHTGEFCKNECQNKTYGVDCYQACGNCRYGGVCLRTTGHCPDGCEAGYQGDTCHERCPVGRYGIRCSWRCPFCYKREGCHPMTGQCPQGCASGYKGSSCDIECEDGLYGPNCSYTCGHCKLNKPCDKFTGFCVLGCDEGYDGQDCAKALTALSKEASVVGGVVAGVVVVFVILVMVVIAVFIYRKKRFRKTMIVNGEQKSMPTQETTLDSIRETDLLLRTPSAESCPDVEEEFTKTKEEPIYVNVNTKKLTQPVKLDDLQEHIRKGKAHEHEIMKKEHADLPSGLLALCHAAIKPENKPKNRYGDIIAYDHSRVVLTPLPHDPDSDYVNANYMDGYDKPKAYIASQGPNKAMLNDFWRMVWQQKATKIVMLTNLVETCKKKCEQYWPEESSHTYGDVLVEKLHVAEYTDYTIRTFKISLDKINRIIKQFHFTSWTDHGAPTYASPLLNFRRKVHQYNPDNQGPILVHCSAGIGRTGTYIATDYLLQQAKTEDKIDLLQYSQIMRSNRVNMIQTWQQYEFVYEALLEAVMAGETTISCSAFCEAYEELCTLKPKKTTTPLEDQFEVLLQLSPNIEKDECKAALISENIAKSRFRNILPANRYRPHLYTAVEGCNDFINAVFLPSYTHRDAFIVTQMPLPNTVADFWRLLYDYHSDTVVMLNEFDRNDKSCALYWPEEYGYTVEYGPLSIELLFSSEADTNITVRTFKLTNSLKGEDRAVKQFQFNAWPDYKSVPTGTSAFIRLTDAVQEWTKQNGKGPVTVHCMNGASKSGLFCASSLMFERMRIDHEVDVYQTVKQIRMTRPHFVENIEQYQFCYQMALTYLEKQPLSSERTGFENIE